MAIIERTRPYETLIRHNADGSIGAHHVTIYELVKDDDILSATISEPVPLDTAADGQGSLTQVLGGAAAQALSRNTVLEQSLADRDATIENLNEQLAAAIADNQPDQGTP